MIVFFAICLLIGCIFVWRYYYNSKGNSLTFWNNAAKHPDLALGFLLDKEDWVILVAGDDEIKKYRGNADYIGPFKLRATVGIDYVLFAKEHSIENVQQEFVDLLGLCAKKPIPWISSLAVLFAIFRMIAVSVKEDGFSIILGEGLLDLSTCIFLGGLVMGCFQILNFNRRVPTLIAAGVIFVVAQILFNV